YEKLQANGVDFIAARLGSVKNKQKFISTQIMPLKEKLVSWKLNVPKQRKINAEINMLSNKIADVLKEKNRLAILQSEFESIATEQKYFLAYFSDNFRDTEMPAFRKLVNPAKLIDLWWKIETEKRASLFVKIWAYFFCGVKINNFYKQDSSNVIAALQKSYYEAKIDKLKNTIERIKDYISSNDISGNVRRHADLSMKIFQSYIANKYIETPRKFYSLNDLWKRSKEFIKDYPVVLSTTYSLRNSLSNDYVYDYVIVDEASQVDLATFIIALSCAKNAVVVGDKKQLSNVIDDVAKSKDHEIFSQFNISEKYMFSKHSALSTITDLFGDKIPSQLLREHYRCHPKIIGFCNKMFYKDQLIILTPEIKDSRDPLKIYETVKGNHARDHVNQRQIDVTLNEVVPKEGLNLIDGSVGIVTPYRNHANALNNRLVGKNVLASTVDKFQGREKEVIILNTVDNKISDFTANPNRLNVIVSRARRQLIVVTNGNENSENTSIDELINYIKYNNYEEINSNINSIFDNLYSSYISVKLKKIHDNSSPAEDLMLDLINTICKENNFTNLGAVFEYPLKMLIDISGLEGREKEYVQNNWTRVDFVIFRKTSKQPLLAIEVDGYAFHNSNNNRAKIQSERDAIKNKLLSGVKIPLIRFNTTGSNEKMILTDKLKELLEVK
ncbi:MAG: DUF2726 domain-containing protein, partial [Endomicrobium sp.]|nr:DUF2726 domain-containing protein [Endomicrobium sp.]